MSHTFLLFLIIVILFSCLVVYTVKTPDRVRETLTVRPAPATTKKKTETAKKPLANSAKYAQEARARGATTLALGVNTSSNGDDTSGFGSAVYTNRIVEMQKMIDVLSNPNKTPIEKVNYLLSTETPFKLRNDFQLKPSINNLQACIKNYIGQIIVVNNQIRANRPRPKNNSDQTNRCDAVSTRCIRYDNADKVSKYLHDNSLDFMKQLTYLLSPDFLMRRDPDYTNLLATLSNGCIQSNLTAIVTFTKNVYKSWIENDSANLAIIQCKGKDMFTAECAERAKYNPIHEPGSVNTNLKTPQNAKTTPIPRATGRGRPPTLIANPSIQGLSATAQQP
jgi:hypothetical protein